MKTGAVIPTIAAYHIPTKEFYNAFEEKGYPIKRGIVIGVDVPAHDGNV